MQQISKKPRENGIVQRLVLGAVAAFFVQKATEGQKTVVQCLGDQCFQFFDRRSNIGLFVDEHIAANQTFIESFGCFFSLELTSPQDFLN